MEELGKQKKKSHSIDSVDKHLKISIAKARSPSETLVLNENLISTESTPEQNLKPSRKMSYLNKKAKISVTSTKEKPLFLSIFFNFIRMGTSYISFLIVLIALVLVLIQSFNYFFYIYNRSSTSELIDEINLNKLFNSRINAQLVIELNQEEEDAYEKSFTISNNESFLSSLFFSVNGSFPSYSALNRSTTQLSNAILENEMIKFKSALNKAYSDIENPLIYCPRIPETLKGYLNSTLILEKANLTSLVEFFDMKNLNITKDKKSKKKQPSKNDLFYLENLPNFNSSNSSNEYWLLWNTRNISLLNMSLSYFGEDGYRVRRGGSWKPKNCKSNFKIAIIIPFRDRLPHLKVLLYYLHLVLQRQQHDYRIFVIEPTTPLEVRFNKGRVMNAAYLEALKQDPDIDCFIFHDVDLVPEDDRTMYSCPPRPRHLSAAIDKFDYVLPYQYLVGGVFAISTQHYKLVNGYSNAYWGWGAEDDDLSVRILSNKLKIYRHPTQFSRFKMMRHKPQKLNPNRIKHLNRAKMRQKKDGLNSIKYTIVEKKLFTGFTYILIDIGNFDEKK